MRFSGELMRFSGDLLSTREAGDSGASLVVINLPQRTHSYHEPIVNSLFGRLFVIQISVRVAVLS